MNLICVHYYGIFFFFNWTAGGNDIYTHTHTLHFQIILKKGAVTLVDIFDPLQSEGLKEKFNDCNINKQILFIYLRHGGGSVMVNGDFESSMKLSEASGDKPQQCSNLLWAQKLQRSF